MLTAVFKDYLILDDVYEFLDAQYSMQESQHVLRQFAKTQN